MGAVAPCPPLEPPLAVWIRMKMLLHRTRNAFLSLNIMYHLLRTFAWSILHYSQCESSWFTHVTLLICRRAMLNVVSMEIEVRGVKTLTVSTARPQIIVRSAVRRVHLPPPPPLLRPPLLQQPPDLFPRQQQPTSTLMRVHWATSSHSVQRCQPPTATTTLTSAVAPALATTPALMVCKVCRYLVRELQKHSPKS